MKRKTVLGIMLILLLLNMLSVTFEIAPSLADTVASNILNEGFVKNQEEANEAGQPKASEESLRDFSQNKIDSSKGKMAEDATRTRSIMENKWNFNDTSEWGKVAFVEDNLTRLVIGTSKERPVSYVEFERITAQYQAKIVNTVAIRGETRAVVVELPLTFVAAFAEKTRISGLASYIEPSMKVEAQFVPNDPYWSLQWGPQKIEANWAWNTTLGDPSVLVAVVDTGIYYYHPDLAANYVSGGYDWANNDADPIDDHGHGTHVAGTIAAVLNNDIGIAGLAQVRIMAEKVLTSEGSGYWEWVASGIIHAVDQSADIISMSLGEYSDSALVYEAVRYAYDSGVLIVAAAGNDNTNLKLYPAGYDEVVSVAATDRYDNKASFSNWGDWIELAAPGVDICSTVPWGYESWSGTSMATPHISGVAALVWSQFPTRTRDWVRLWLRYTADDLGDSGFDMYYGYGRINARKAVEQSPPAHELMVSDWQTPPYVEPGTSAIVNATILNFGVDETDATLQLFANDTIVGSTLIDFLGEQETETVSMVWNPTIEGLYNVTLYVVPVPGETSVENNVMWKYVYVGFPLKAVVLHSAGNVIGDIIANWQVLNSEWRLFGDTMVSIDYTTLNKDSISYEDIAATEAGVLIISCAYDPSVGWEFTDSEIEAIKHYVYEGHGLIATAGTLYYEVPNNNKLAPLFGLNEAVTWTSTGTDLLHLVNTTHSLFRNVPNPFVFVRVGTSLPFDGRWDSNELVGGEYLALGNFSEAAVVTYPGLVFISPWLEIIPAYYHHHLQLLYNAITWSQYQKPEHELAVSIEAPARLRSGESTVLNATVSNLGRNNGTNVKLQLLINDVIVSSQLIPELVVGSSFTMSFSWTPPSEGAYNVTAYAPPLSGEEFTWNNVARKIIMVLVITIRNVLVYTDDYAVSSSSRYPVVALNNLGINYTHYVDDPFGFGSALVSQPWDLVVVDHANWFALGNFWTELETYVHNGGFLILSTFDIDGSHSEPTTLWDAMGVRWVSDMLYSEPVYRWDPTHPIFTFPNTVGDITSYIEGYGDDGDHVAATTGTPIAGFAPSLTEDYAGIVVGNAYQTVLFSFLLCEFRYDQDVDGKLDAVELWENAIVHVTRRDEHDLTASLKVPRFLRAGDSVLVNATVSNRGLNNETNVELRLLVNSTVVDSASIPELLIDTSYTLSNLWTPTLEGMYNVTAYSPPVLGEDNTRNNAISTRVSVTTRVVALFQNWYPWNYPSNEEVLDRYGVPYVVFSSRDFGSVDLSLFTKVIIASDQDKAFYDGMNTYRWWFEDYVNNGGMLEIHAADWGGHGGHWMGPLPGGLEWASYYSNYVTIVDPSHPVITTPNLISDAELDGWSSSVHGYFSTYPADSHIVIVEDYTSQPSYLLFGYGTGMIVASSQTLEWALEHRYSRILENSLLYMPVRREHDVAVTLRAPAHLEPGGSALVNATVCNVGLNNETNVELRLLINGTLVNSTVVPQLLRGESYEITHLWTPTFEGTCNVTAHASPVLDEEFIANNVATKMVSVRYAPKLLVVNTPVPEDTGALDRLGYEYTLVSATEFVSVDLYRFNVLFVGWMPGEEAVNALLARASDIAEWVAAGNGIVTLSEFSESNRWAWLPLSVSSGFYGGDNVHILDPTHPVMFNLTDAELCYWWSSYHGYFYSYHADWSALAQGVEAGYPITLVATYGEGRIAITHQDPDYHFYYASILGAGKLLRSMIEWATPQIAPARTATLDIDPDTLNLKSKGQWITAYVQLPEGYDAEDIEVSTILLNETIPPVLDPKYGFVTNPSEYLVDHNNDGILERMVKFDRAAVESFIYSRGIRYGNVALARALTITGKLFDGTPFEGSDTISVNYAGDANNDGIVNILDAGMVSAHWYPGPPIGPLGYDANADFNKDGIVNIIDAGIVSVNWGQTVP